MGDEIRLWKCKNGHTLGQTRRSGKGIDRLFLYRQAVDLTGDHPNEIDVIAVVEGTVMDIRCGLCGEVRTWMTGQEAMKRLLSQYASMHQIDADKLLKKFNDISEENNREEK